MHTLRCRVREVNPGAYAEHDELDMRFGLIQEMPLKTVSGTISVGEGPALLDCFLHNLQASAFAHLLLIYSVSE